MHINTPTVPGCQASYPNTPTFKREVEEWRGFLGRYGVTGKMQTTRIGELSEGQKSRIVFAMLCMARPNMVSGHKIMTIWPAKQLMVLSRASDHACATLNALPSCSSLGSTLTAPHLPSCTSQTPFHRPCAAAAGRADQSLGH